MKITEKFVREFNTVQRNRLKVEKAYAEKQAKRPDSQTKKQKAASIAPSPEEKAEKALAKLVERFVESVDTYLPEGLCAYIDKPRKYSSALASIKVKAVVVKDDATEEDNRQGHRNEKGADSSESNRDNKKKEPIVMAIDLYRSPLNYHSIGTVAVYANDLDSIKATIEHTNLFYGLQIEKVTKRYGLMPYLDMKVKS